LLHILQEVRAIYKTRNQLIDITDLQSIASHSIDGLSLEGEIVLIADKLTGLLEDPLIAITGLRITPAFVPDDIANRLVLPFDDLNYRRCLFEVSDCFYRSHDVDRFMSDFDTLFHDAVRRFDKVYGLGNIELTTNSWFGKLVYHIKSNFLKLKLFAYNNEKVSRGSKLRGELIKPLLEVLGDNAPYVLTTINEEELLDLAIQKGVIQAGSISQYLPNIDYISNSEPELYFQYVLIH